jgi:hypothetical protein
MADRWYYGYDEKKFGPLSARLLRYLAASGQLLPSDTVWKEGIEKGVLARDVKNLFPPTPALATPVSASVPPVKLPSSSQPPANFTSAENLAPAVQSGASPPLPDAQPTPTGVRAGKVLEALTPGDATVLSNPEPVVFVGDKEPTPQGKVPAALNRPISQQKPVGKARAVAVRGAIIVGQDGTNVRYTKKCTACGYVDSFWNTMPITNGWTRITFFCPKCRKKREGEIQGFPH